MGMNIIRFEDDIAVVAGSEEDLRRSQNHYWKKTEVMDSEYTYNLRINNTKTKVIVCDLEARTRVNITVNGEKLEDVNVFSYLGGNHKGW